uniref:Replication protein A OB domain-containing protein n=1 Tax=Amphimedon queenslandica TaxID=400682 RepID=A0A1X7VA58_AMPQE
MASPPTAMTRESNSNLSTPVKYSAAEYDINEIQIDDNAILHGLITELSPITVRTGNCKYFSGMMTDGIKVVRFISSQPSMRPSFKKRRQQESPIAIAGCHIEANKFEFSLEVRAGKHATISQPQKTKKLKVDDITSEGSFITIYQLICTAINQSITVPGKIVNVNVSANVTTKTGTKLKKQDCALQDTSRICRVVLWEDVDKIKKGQCYKLINTLVRQYDGANYLSISHITKIETIESIELVSDNEELQEICEAMPIAEGKISAVLNTDEYQVCITCTGNVNSIKDHIRQCIVSCYS